MPEPSDYAIMTVAKEFFDIDVSLDDKEKLSRLRH